MENLRIVKDGAMAHVTFTDDFRDVTITVPYDDSLESAIISDYQNWSNMAIYENEQINRQMNTLTKYQFLSRFTIAERLAIFALESTEPMVKMWLEMFRICEEIDIADPETIAGINMMETMGVIVPGRAGEIVSIS